ncbi:MAG: 30S ribosomal protein S5 [Candidatus Moranbacteria bacterium]|nr:30S ribosomal protein S5 [Candidatus Moranbacteria bacterium]
MANKRFNGKKKQEYEQKLLDLARVARVMKGGRRFSFRATVVVGNKKGKVGVGTAKGSDVSDSISKAANKAKKEVVNVKRLDSTISFRVDEKFRGAEIMIKPAKEGKGIVAGGAMRSVLELAGIKNVTAKSLGSSNKINVAKATVNALKALEGKRPEKEKKEGGVKKGIESEKKASGKNEKANAVSTTAKKSGEGKKAPAGEKDASPKSRNEKSNAAKKKDSAAAKKSPKQTGKTKKTTSKSA